jgi:transposase-like protein
VPEQKAPCPHCESQDTVQTGHTFARTRHFCLACGKSFEHRLPEEHASAWWSGTVPLDTHPVAPLKWRVSSLASGQSLDSSVRKPLSPCPRCQSVEVAAFPVNWATDSLYLRCYDCNEVWTVVRDDAVGRRN